MRILFLRSGNSTFYHDRAKELGYVAHTFAPILKRRLPVGDLEEALKDFENYDGLIMTSVETVKIVSDLKISLPCDYKIFVVGKATGEAARNAGFKNILGENSGDAVRLAPIISDAFPENKSKIKLMFPGAATKIGGLAKKILPITVVDLPVYETLSRSEEEIKSEIVNEDPFDFVVYFSPSGVTAAKKSILLHSPNAKVIAIGPTTAKSLENPLVSVTPDVEGVFDVISGALS